MLGWRSLLGVLVLAAGACATVEPALGTQPGRSLQSWLGAPLLRASSSERTSLQPLAPVEQPAPVEHHQARHPPGALQHVTYRVENLVPPRPSQAKKNEEARRRPEEDRDPPPGEASCGVGEIDAAVAAAARMSEHTGQQFEDDVAQVSRHLERALRANPLHSAAGDKAIAALADAARELEEDPPGVDRWVRARYALVAAFDALVLLRDTSKPPPAPLRAAGHALEDIDAHMPLDVQMTALQRGFTAVALAYQASARR
jgi:hypothetical protein